MIKKLITLSVFLLIAIQLFPCTNFIITKGASVDGSTMVTYSADSHTLYGELYFFPAADHPAGAMRKIIEWDTGKPLGSIPEVSHTYSVIGNMNEHQLVISETTFGGRPELSKQTGAIMDYGSLIYVTLQRAKTAREAIKIIASLVDDYGYASSGESFSIGDPKEVWIMELIGKGEGEKGAVWVALKVPDGYVSGHANQARITTFPLNDKDNCVYSNDVISFAREKGWFDGLNKDFSFSDTYAPLDFGAARFCESRVWAGFNRISSGMDKYLEYIKGNIEKDPQSQIATNRMPLWVKPDKKVSVKDVMELMRDHFEDTELDMSKDIGAGPFHLPYRWRGLTWNVDSATYCNERAISTQQTGFSFVGQCRSWLPNPVGGILWFGVDDTYSTCYAPMYCGITEIPECFKVGNGDLLTYSETAAFWTFNKVTNFAYSRYNSMIVDIRKTQERIEGTFISNTPAVDQAAKLLLESADEKYAREFLTTYSINEANGMTKKWEELFKYLLIKYIDGNIKKEENGAFSRNEYNMPSAPFQPGYPDWWYEVIVKSVGDHFKVTE